MLFITLISLIISDVAFAGKKIIHVDDLRFMNFSVFTLQICYFSMYFMRWGFFILNTSSMKFLIKYIFLCVFCVFFMEII